MALSQAELEARIASIRRARDSGVLVVRHGDEQTTFRSLSEMNAIIAELEGELGSAMGKNRNRFRYVRQTSKGL